MMIIVLYDYTIITVSNLIHDWKQKLTFKWHHLETAVPKILHIFKIVVMVGTVLFIYLIFPSSNSSILTPSLFIFFLQAFSWETLSKWYNK